MENPCSHSGQLALTLGPSCSFEGLVGALNLARLPTSYTYIYMCVCVCVSSLGENHKKMKN